MEINEKFKQLECERFAMEKDITKQIEDRSSEVQGDI